MTCVQPLMSEKRINWAHMLSSVYWNGILLLLLRTMQIVDQRSGL